jgi:hypothetical protein
MSQCVVGRASGISRQNSFPNVFIESRRDWILQYYIIEKNPKFGILIRNQMYGVFILPKGEASEDRFGKQLFVDILGGGSVGIFE